MKKCFCCLVIVLLAATAAHAGPWWELEGRYWYTSLTAKTRASIIPGAAFEFDLPKDLGMKNRGVLDARFTWNIGLGNRIRLDYSPISYHGNSNIARSITFAGQTYTAGMNVRSDLTVHYARAAWTWQFIKVPFSDIVKFGPMVEAKGFWVQSHVMATGLPNTSQSVGLVLPTAGLALDINPTESWSFYAEASGLPGGGYGYFLDAEAGIRFIPHKYVSVTGGWRLLDLQAKKSPNYLKWKMQGPFAGASVRF